MANEVIPRNASLFDMTPFEAMQVEVFSMVLRKIW
jgi:hypothetical protein